uniref:Rho-GAP domain-containing protein n=1 Tax=Syphacia muris TaxID=451379 RepID=A0A0N5ASI3_9BILA
MRSRGRLSGGSINIASPNGDVSPKSPQSPESKTKIMTGNFSPVHTRRRTQSEDVTKVLPDFAAFDISQKCSKILSSFEPEVHDIDGELLDLLQIESELNMLLTHCIDHQKKIIGEIHFLETGDYRSEDISKRLMPTYELRNFDNIAPSTSAEAEEKASTEAASANEEDDYDSSCPTVNMPGKFWKFIKDYQSELDETFLYKYYTQILSPLFTDDSVRSADSDAKSSRIMSYSPNSKSKTPISSPLASPTYRRVLKRQGSTGKPLETPAKTPKLENEGIDSLLAETIQAWSSEEKLKFPWMQNCFSDGSACNGTEPLFNRCDQENNDMEEEFDKKEADGGDKFADRFDKSVLGIEYKNLKDTVINVINASQIGFSKDVEKNTLKKEFWPDYCSGGSSGSQVIAHFEAFKKTLMNFVKGAMEIKFSADHDVMDGVSNAEFNRGNENSVFMPSCKTEGIEVDERKSEALEIGQNLDQVSAALKKAEEDLQDRNESCRFIAVIVWHRILAEFIRKKLETDLSNATKELNVVREKYFRSYPPKKPANDKEREECAVALRKYNSALKNYYEIC